MLLGHVRCQTRCGPPPLTRCTSLILRPRIETSKRSFLSLTRPCARPRARPFVVATWTQELQRRGAKRKASINLDDVPQGAIASDPLLPQNDAEPEYPPLLQQVHNTMLKFNHCVVVTRVGGFYEVCTDPLRSYFC
jgi:hypothetical protein